MSLKFDHLVHFSTSLSTVAEKFSSLGFHAVKGGSHPSWGTYNSLCYFSGLRYIEWIGIQNLSIASTSDNLLIQQLVEDSFKGEGFSQIAFRTDNIDNLAIRLSAQGFNTIGPVQGSRMKEDGTLLKWSMLFINDQQYRFPFFIQWGQPDMERNLQLGPMTIHENGTPTLSYIGYAVKDAPSFASNFCRIIESKRLHIYQTYSEIHIEDFAIRFYEKEGTHRPILVGITGVLEDNIVDVAGGSYHLTRV
ncbi:VOC family protein [Bacillus sp. BGMRC 2118]|nr:VOC family protein [Bacillus sp. BGMRC 2118]